MLPILFRVDTIAIIFVYDGTMLYTLENNVIVRMAGKNMYKFVTGKGRVCIHSSVQCVPNRTYIWFEVIVICIRPKAEVFSAARNFGMPAGLSNVFDSRRIHFDGT